MNSNLTASLRINGNSRIVHLTWNNPNHHVFQILMAQSKELPLFQVGKTDASCFDIPVDYYFSRVFRFAIVPAHNNRSPEEVVELKLPTIDLPKPRITSIKKSGNEVTINWMFPFDIPDLKGFSLSINHKSLPMKINRRVRSISLPPDQPGSGQLRVLAFTDNHRCESQSDPANIQFSTHY